MKAHQPKIYSVLTYSCLCGNWHNELKCGHCHFPVGQGAPEFLEMESQQFQVALNVEVGDGPWGLNSHNEKVIISILVNSSLISALK
jgi:hypothetical protein